MHQELTWYKGLVGMEGTDVIDLASAVLGVHQLNFPQISPGIGLIP